MTIYGPACLYIMLCCCWCTQDLQLKHQALDAFKETVMVFEEQLKLHDTYQRHAAPHEVAK